MYGVLSIYYRAVRSEFRDEVNCLPPFTGTGNCGVKVSNRYMLAENSSLTYNTSEVSLCTVKSTSSKKCLRLQLALGRSDSNNAVGNSADDSAKIKRAIDSHAFNESARPGCVPFEPQHLPRPLSVSSSLHLAPCK